MFARLILSVLFFILYVLIVPVLSALLALWLATEMPEVAAVPYKAVFKIASSWEFLSGIEEVVGPTWYGALIGCVVGFFVKSFHTVLNRTVGPEVSRTAKASKNGE